MQHPEPMCEQHTVHRVGCESRADRASGSDWSCRSDSRGKLHKRESEAGSRQVPEGRPMSDTEKTNFQDTQEGRRAGDRRGKGGDGSIKQNHKKP